MLRSIAMPWGDGHDAQLRKPLAAGQEVSFGRIPAEALDAPQVRELFDGLAKESDSKLY